jgi:repressor LexA
MQLTPKQQQILDFILDFRAKEGCSPSIPEIQAEFGFRSPNAVAAHLEALAAKGAIRRTPRRSRSIEVLSPLPLLGAIAAGHPERVEQTNPIDSYFVDLESLGFRPKRGLFALRVRGDSMKDASILNKDIVVVEPSAQPKAGQIVVALIDGESTLKRLVQNRGRWYLKAENPAYPELVPKADLVIQGVVRMVIRQLD